MNKLNDKSSHLLQTKKQSESQVLRIKKIFFSTK
jgi:hypothetical protein